MLNVCIKLSAHEIEIRNIRKDIGITVIYLKSLCFFCFKVFQVFLVSQFKDLNIIISKSPSVKY